jgi:predicted  nucleic acid-binding Zn-ribbon protein
MSDQPTQDLATRAFQKRVLDEFAAIRSAQAAMQQDITEIHSQQAAMAKNVSSLDARLTSLEQRVDERLKETRPIWEGVQDQVQTLQEQVQRVLEKFDAVILEFYELRGEFKIHGRRIAELERRVPT